jgi:c-di-AMP phosphodiesterase-like protein
MDFNALLSEAKKAIESARSVYILTHEKPTHDSIGSSLCLYLGLTSLGKSVSLVCPDPVTVEFADYVGVNKFTSALAGKNFVISLDYVEGSIEKVSYNIEGNKFNLVIEPRPGFEPFTQDKVHFTKSGLGGDLVITVDTISPGGYRQITDGLPKEAFKGKPVINLDRHGNNSGYGTINLVDPQAAATCEIAASLLSVLGVKLSADIATNLLNALYHGTGNFQTREVSGRTFELASACIKAGGRRIFSEPLQAVSAPEPEVSSSVKNPAKSQAPVYSAFSAEEDHSQAKTPAIPPSDWLKPKIFRSSQNS